MTHAEPEAHEEASILVGAHTWVHYDFRGPKTAPVLVLVPPLGGSGELFEPFRADLARDFRVLTCEPPGSGPSSAPSGIPSTRTLATRIAELLAFLEVERAHLFGISLGGMIAQWLAIEHPARIDRLLLASTAARGLTPTEALTAGNLALARALFSPGEAGVNLALEVVSERTRDSAPERARIEEAVREHPPDRSELLWLTAAAAAHDTRRRVGEITAPTLVLTGEDDVLIPPPLQTELRDAIPGAVQTTIEGAGHDVTLDQPTVTARRLREFLGRSR